MLQVFRGFSFIYGDYVLSFNHVRRTTNKLADIMENQGVLIIKSKVVLSWPEIVGFNPVQKLPAYEFLNKEK